MAFVVAIVISLIIGLLFFTVIDRLLAVGPLSRLLGRSRLLRLSLAGVPLTQLRLWQLILLLLFGLVLRVDEHHPIVHQFQVVSQVNEITAKEIHQLVDSASLNVDLEGLVASNHLLGSDSHVPIRGNSDLNQVNVGVNAQRVLVCVDRLLVAS